jgi:phosphatidate phosphatase APP1
MYKILPYYGFGNNDRVIFRGRVVVDNGYEKYRNKSGLVPELIGFWKRFSVKPASDIAVEISFESKTQTVKTDEYGTFKVVFDPGDIQDDKWLVAQASIYLDNDQVIIANLNSINDVSGNEFGIISDIDDTILISNATKKLRLIYLTVFKKPSERHAFDGVAELYSALVQGPNNNASNPIFYVSSSHWNLFDLLTEFMEVNKLPKGPLLLKKVRGIRYTITSAGNHDHKKLKILEVLETYPKLQFVLIGDSGQRDAAIYASIAKSHPNQIRAILLRDVTDYEDEIVTSSIQVTPDHIPFRIFKTQTQAINIAAELGLIHQ